MTEPVPAPVDEAVAADGTDRPHPAPAVRAVRARDLRALAAEVAAAARVADLRHGAGDHEHPFHVDPVPRLLPGAEFDRLAAGLVQRLRALEAFVADAHGPREAVRAGVVPAVVLDTSRYLAAELPRPAAWIGMAGLDVARGADGQLVVLEDNVRTPTMLAYALAVRDVVTGVLDGVEGPGPAPVREAARDAVRRMLRAAAPGTDPVVAVLGDGPRSAVPWEIAALAELAGAPSVAAHELRRDDDRLLLPDGRAVDVLWQRTSEERLRDDAGRIGELGELLMRPLCAGTVAVVNAFGSGVADDKRVHPCVEDLVRSFCGEEPLLRSVPTDDLGDPGARATALGRLPELVLKPRSGSGGHGVLVGPRAAPGQLEAARAVVEADPGGWVAQEVVALSTHPTVVDGALAPRHVDLRPFAFVTDARDGGTSVEVTVLRGGFTRVALEEGDLVVNASQGGGGKDTWVV